MRVLLTRPLDAAQETADALRARGHDALIEPLLTIVNEPGPVLDVSAYALLVLTSANGARAAAGCIGSRKPTSPFVRTSTMSRIGMQHG